MPEKKEMIKLRTSRKAYFPVYLMIFILLFAVIAIKVSGKEINQFALNLVLIFSAALIIFIEVHRLKDLYEINNTALVHSVGILSRKTRKVDLISVSDADSKQTAWQRILNYGDVAARMFSQDSTLLVKNIHNPVKFADFLEMKMDEKNGIISNKDGN